MLKGMLKDYLDELAEEIERAAKGKLKNGKLKNSLEIHAEDEGLVVLMEDYGHFKDEGVSGTERKFNTRFSYKNAMPKAKPLEEWAKTNNLTLENGMSYRSLSFVLQKSVFKKGIKPSLFLTEPFTDIITNSSLGDLGDKILSKLKEEI